SLDRRRVLHFNVTKHPTATWTAQQVVEACAFELPGRFLLRDNDSIYGAEFCRRVEALGLEQIRTAPRSPWQNGYAERWVGSLRRDCLDHVIAINERQLRRVIREYVDSYHADRTHPGWTRTRPTGESRSRRRPARSSRCQGSVGCITGTRGGPRRVLRRDNRSFTGWMDHFRCQGSKRAGRTSVPENRETSS